MRHCIRGLLGLALVLVAAGTAAAQDTPKDILERAFKAHGGYEKLAKIHAYQVTAKGVLLVLGKEIPFTSEGFSQLPDQFKSTMKFAVNGAEYTSVEIFNRGRITLLVNDKDSGDLDDKKRAEMKEQLYAELVATLTPLIENKFTLKALADSQIDGQAVAGIQVSSKGHRDVNLFFDKATGLHVATKQWSYDPLTKKDSRQEQIYQDFKVVAGIKYAGKELLKREGEKFMEMEIIRYQPMDKLDDSVFKP